MADVGPLHHTGFTVSDLERSLAFYEGLLGLEVVMRQEKEGGYLAEIVGYPGAHVRMAHLRAPDSDHRLELFEYVSPAGEPHRVEPRQIGPTHVCLIVDDLPALYGRLREAGIESFFTEPVTVDTGANAGGLALYFRDPDGIILELFQPPRAR